MAEEESRHELEVGDDAPDFTLSSGDGKEAHLASFKGKKEVILYFYPKDDTPGCTQEACEFQEASSQLEASGVVVLGVSRDSLASHQRFAEKYKLSFPILSDPDAVICKAYGVYKLKKNYGKEYWGIERSTFVIDRSGKLAKVFRGVRVKGHVEAVLSAIAPPEK